MGKYKVEVTYTVTYSHTFEVEASNPEEASNKAVTSACDFNMRDGKEVDSEYAFDIVESPVDRMECPSENDPADLAEGDTCPECGCALIEVGMNPECPNCGKFF